jgi:hypothetical protein
LDTHPIDSLAIPADRFIASCLLVVRLRTDRSTIIIPVSPHCYDVLDLAVEFLDQGAPMVAVKLVVSDWTSRREDSRSYECEWRLERETQAAKQTRALLEDKKRRDAKRDAAAAAHVCASCGHTAGAHEPPGVEAYGCHGGGGDCTCEGFSSGLVQVSR